MISKPEHPRLRKVCIQLAVVTLVFWAFTSPASKTDITVGRSAKTASQGTDSKVAQQARPAVVDLCAVDKQKIIVGRGSGFFISEDGLLITARHLTTKGAALFATTADGKEHPVTQFVADDLDNNLTLLKINGSGFPHLALAHANPQTNQWTATLGAYGSSGKRYFTGSVVRVIYERALMGTVLADVQLQSEDCGSPMLNEAGEVLGIIYLTGRPNRSGGAPAMSIQRLVEDARKTKPIPYSKRPVKGGILLLDENFSKGAAAFDRSDWRTAVKFFKMH